MQKNIAGSVSLTLDFDNELIGILLELLRQALKELKNPGTGLTLEQLKCVVEHRNPFGVSTCCLEEEIQLTQPKSIVPAYSSVGQVFELTLDGDASDNEPLQIPKDCGNTLDKWEYKGIRVRGKKTCRFKLVKLADCRNLSEVKNLLKVHGKIPGGQWIKAFMAAYPQHCGKTPIGIADDSWIEYSGIFPGGQVLFPIIKSNGELTLFAANREQKGECFWLVVAE